MSNSSNSSNSSSGGVILEPPAKKKQIAPSKRWVFTLNNYTQEHIDLISSIVPDICDKYIIGKEVGDSGTPHLQGFISFKEKKRPKSIIPIPEIHWEKALGDDMSQNYCGKEGDVILQKSIPRPLVKVTRDLLQPKQLAIADRFIEPEHPLFGRKVYWFWENDGNWGKSFTALYMVDQMNAILVSGANNDILCGVQKYIETHGNAPGIIIFDIPRVNKEHVSYQAIESLKNGCFFSGKYESGMVRFNKPHLIVFSNEEPETHKLSEDRWVIEELSVDD